MGESTLLLETENVTTSDTSFTLSSTWDIYKIITITVEMYFAEPKNVKLITKNFITKCIRTDYPYATHRFVPSGTSAGEASFYIKFDDNKNSVILSKVSNKYNGARKVYIYGIL